MKVPLLDQVLTAGGDDGEGSLVELLHVDENQNCQLVWKKVLLLTERFYVITLECYLCINT